MASKTSSQPRKAALTGFYLANGCSSRGLRLECDERSLDGREMNSKILTHYHEPCLSKIPAMTQITSRRSFLKVAGAVSAGFTGYENGGAFLGFDDPFLFETIETIEAKAYELYQKMLEETTKRKEKMFKELDEVGEKNISDKNTYNNINQMIDRSKIP